MPFALTRLNPRYQLRLAVIVALALSSLSSSGCVRRRLTVRSNPPGALVYVDNQQIGFTPCSVDFTYYGTREIRLVKSGFETLTINQPIPTPWYQIPPLDFVSENLVPANIRDNRTVSFTLQPQILMPVEEIIARGSELRTRTQTGTVIPAAGELGPPAAAMPAGAPLLAPGAAIAPPPTTNFAPPALPASPAGGGFRY
jgi:hypothetical protein